MTRQPHGGFQPSRPTGETFQVLFKPDLPERELYDTLAERQAQMLEVNSAQLRRFFGEIKDLYRQFHVLIANVTDEAQKQAIYAESIEPRFKMVRSKVAYASRPRGQSNLRAEFATFLKTGIERVGNQQHFVRFVTHLEAVVGFMYGEGKVRQ